MDARGRPSDSYRVFFYFRSLRHNGAASSREGGCLHDVIFLKVIIFMLSAADLASSPPEPRLTSKRYLCGTE